MDEPVEIVAGTVTRAKSPTDPSEFDIRCRERRTPGMDKEEAMPTMSLMQDDGAAPYVTKEAGDTNPAPDATQRASGRHAPARRKDGDPEARNGASAPRHDTARGRSVAAATRLRLVTAQAAETDTPASASPALRRAWNGVRRAAAKAVRRRMTTEMADLASRIRKLQDSDPR